MNTRHGRPPKGLGQTQDEWLQLRLGKAEKRAFEDAARLSGLPVSAWVRERLKLTARHELEQAGLPVAFIPSPSSEGPV